MRQISKKDIRSALRDRWWFGLVLLNIVVAVAVILTIAVTIQPKETQVINHYSSFGVTGFYRNYWYYLWGYALLEIIILVSHTFVSLKLRQLDRRDLSLALLWSTVGISVIVMIFASSIIKIAALG